MSHAVNNSVFVYMKRLLVGLCLFPILIYAQSVKLQQNLTSIQLDNGIVSVSFNKQNADLNALSIRGISLLGKGGRAYLLAPDFNMNQSVCTVVKQTDSLIELSFLHVASNHFTYDLHYVLKSGDAGIYCYLLESHQAKDSVGNYGQTRWGIKADESLFDYHLVRDSIQGPMPKMSELTHDVQDWTFLMPDSTYYTKYNYADYIEDRYVHGMAGSKGFGLFVINPSHEYLNGGPTKQYQNVHSTPFLINMFNCGHFLSDIRKGDNHIADDWKKLNGPFYLYIAEGKTIPELWNKAKSISKSEQAKWPYTWMSHAEYPLERGNTIGQLLLNGKPAQEDTRVILAAPGYDWQAQSRGYTYDAKTKIDGSFELKAIRPGTYTLYAFGSNQTKEFQQANISIKEGNQNLGKIKWEPATHGNLLWQIGQADRKTTGFKLADHKRAYELMLQPPAQLDYLIGQSKPIDWYYAQTKEGAWKIHFSNTKNYTDSACLTIAVAGCARNPQLDVLVNGKTIKTLRMGNDASVYRSAVAGGYYQLKELLFPSSYLVSGDNTIELRMVQCKPGAGIMYDAIKLEAK